MALTFRPAGDGDAALLGRWVTAPHVAPWWHPEGDADGEAETWREQLRTDPATEYCIALEDDRAVGMLQRYLVADNPDWAQALAPAMDDAERFAGIDYLIGRPEDCGRGLGTRLLTAFTAEVLSRYPDVDGVVVAPQQANRASWRVLERAGYERVWEGQLDTDDPGDAGPAYVYLARRAAGDRP